MTEIFWIILSLLLVALAFVFSGFFYKRITRDRIKELKICREISIGKLTVDVFVNYQDNITKRISNFNKLIIASLVVTFIVVLLIIKVISAESGLPIITAIVGYVLGDNSSSFKNNFLKNKEENGKPE